MLNQTLGIALGAPDSIRAAQIETEINALKINADDLEKIVCGLESKTIPIRRGLPNESPNKPEAPPAVPMPLLVPLAQQMNDICASVRTSVDRLRELQGAIELP